MTQKAPVEVIVARRLAATYESARKRQKDFNLSLAYLYNISQQTRCAYSGELFSCGTANDPNMMTLERFDNSIGYIEGNVIPVKQKYNSRRGNLEIKGLINLRDKTAAKIIRTSDQPCTDKKTLEKLKNIDMYKEQLHKIRAKIETRKAHVKSATDKELITSLEARIIGGEAEAKRLERFIKSIEGGASLKTSQAEIAVNECDILIKSLTRFGNLSRLDKKKLKKGLPLEASLFQLIRGKM